MSRRALGVPACLALLLLSGGLTSRAASAQEDQAAGHARGLAQTEEGLAYRRGLSLRRHPFVSLRSKHPGCVS